MKKNRMHIFLLFAAIVVCILFSTGRKEIVYAGDSTTVTVKVRGTVNYQYAFKTLSLVNKERKKAGLPALKMDQSLLKTAMRRAAEQVLHFGHDRPDGSFCFTANPRMQGENVAVGSSSPKWVMNTWMHSDGHRTNILSPNFVSIGVGCYITDEGVYWSQVFGTSIDKVAKKASYKNRHAVYAIQVAKTKEYLRPSISMPTTIKKGQKEKFYVYWENGMGAMCWLKKSGMIVKSSNPKVCSVKGTTICGLKKGKAKLLFYFPSAKKQAVTLKITVK